MAKLTEDSTREERIAGERFERSFSIAASDIDIPKRMLKLSFASEKPVQRWDWDGPYDEVLRVDESSADLARMNDGGALLSDHNRDKQVGVVEKAWVGDDQKAHAIVRFANDEEGEKELQRAADGIRRNVSFAYKIKAFETKKAEGSNKRDLVTATDWEVLEISLVSVPADPGVGVGRSESGKNEQGKVIPEQPEKEKQERVVNTMATKENEDGKVEVTESREDQILAFGRKFGVDEKWLKSRALDPIATIETVRKEMQDLYKADDKTPSAPETPDSQLGLSEKEAKRYSVCRAVMAQIDPSFEKGAGFERECHEAIVARGVTPQAGGFFMPSEVQTLKRTDLSVGGGLTLGGALVGTDHMPESFIDILRNNMATVGLGITVLSGLTGNPSIPRQDGAGTGYWIGEGTDPTESNITLGQLGLSPKTVGAVQEFTRQLLIQSAPSVDALVMNDIAAVLARTIDLAIIAGTGSSNQPKGVLETTGVDDISQIGAVFSI
jgi:HK97 family phage major capsid protein